MNVGISTDKSTVLIESDWNLKFFKELTEQGTQYVLIESDWNLKKSIDQLKGYGLRVLIESDWNLKYH